MEGIFSRMFKNFKALLSAKIVYIKISKQIFFEIYRELVSSKMITSIKGNIEKLVTSKLAYEISPIKTDIFK